jgi:cell division protein FtsB
LGSQHVDGGLAFRANPSIVDGPTLLVNFDSNFFHSPFAFGFYVASIFTILALFHLVRAKGELARFRRHLSDRLEIEADAMRKIKGETESLKKENESLRVKVNALNDQPERKLGRDLEIYARAERQMLIQVPGFAPAWETAKSAAHNDIAEEEAGRSAPKRLFSRLFGGGPSQTVVALPAESSSKSANESSNGQKRE